jgi:Holliday junction resolvase RusA-like endonuclease
MSEHDPALARLAFAFADVDSPAVAGDHKDAQAATGVGGTLVVTTIRFFVAGKPQTAGSKTAVPMGARMGVIEAGSKESRARKRSWRGDLRDAAMNAMKERDLGWAAGDPLEMTLVIVRTRPSAHMRTGRHAGAVKEWAGHLRPVQRPDATKVLRAVEDALEGYLFSDDAQIVKQTVYKVYGDQCGLTAAAEGLLVIVDRANGYLGPAIEWDIGRAAA